jgi:hypothetical protein
MGYDLHITRADDWIDSTQSPITPDEWHAFIANDPELTPTPEYGPAFVLWHGSSSRHEQPWFDLIDGQILAKNPDEPMIVKMIEIAHKLNAKVQGDDGEDYILTERGLQWQQANATTKSSPRQLNQYSWWKRWLKRS